MPFFPAVVALACLLLMAPSVAPAEARDEARAGATGSARLALSDCRLRSEGAPGVSARCGTLTVPENYAAPGERSITLRVAVVPTLSAHPGEPLFVLAGGPGQAATDFYSAVAPAFGFVARHHDVVLVDQRGTGGSQPLKCQLPEDPVASQASLAQLEALSRACLRSLDGRPAFYTTSVAVRDLDAVREALGIPQLSLYGASYGTRVAQHFVRRYPDRVRRVILDGVVDPSTVVGATATADSAAALAKVLARCAANARCHATFPDPAADLAAAKARVGARPVAVALADPATGAPRDVTISDDELSGALRLLSYSGASAALIPLLLHSAAAGDFRPLAAQVLLYGQKLDAHLAYGMHLAVVCTEDAPDFPPGSATSADRQLAALAAMCRPWPAGVRDADLRAPLRAAVPALVLSGEADPVTPAANGDRAAAGFAGARHLVLPGQGHGQLGTGCVPELMAAFLGEAAASALDTHCIDRLRPAPFFLDYAGPAP